MTYEQQKAAIEATMKAKQKELGDIVTKSAAEKRTSNDAEETQAKAIESDIEKLEVNLKRIDKLIDAQKAVATPVAGKTAQQAAATSEGDPEPSKHVSVKSNMPKGIGFAKAMRARVTAQLEMKNGTYVSAQDIAKSRNEPEQVIRFLEKATVGRTDEAVFAPLVEDDNLAAEFIELLRQRTVFDKLTGFRNVPFNTKMVEQLTGSTAGWVGEGMLKPTTNPTFGTIRIDEHKLAAIAVFTDEFLRNSKPKADAVFLEDLIKACAELIDDTFLGDAAGGTDEPAGILNGVTPIAASGRTVENYEADLLALVSAFIKDNKSLSGAQMVMSEVQAYEFGNLRDALGNGYYSGMSGGINGKALKNIQVVESERADGKIILLKPSEILLADDGQVDVSYSNQATIVNGSDTLNLWQQNMSAVRVERFITWVKRRQSAASYIDYSSVTA